MQLTMWANIEQKAVEDKEHPPPEGDIPEPQIPQWLEKYIQYKFNLYDRTG